MRSAARDGAAVTLSATMRRRAAANPTHPPVPALRSSSCSSTSAMAGPGNVVSLAAHRALVASQARLATAFGRVASGVRIDAASDDPAGLAVSDVMRAQIASFTQAARNASDGLSALQTAQGGLAAVSDDLARMAELATQASSDLLTSDQRQAIQTEFDALRGQIDQTAASTSFNGQNLLDGSLATNGLSVQVGTDSAPTSSVDVPIAGVPSSTLGGATPLSAASLGTASDARAALDAIGAAGASLAQDLAGIGAGMARLQAVGQSIAVSVENLSAASSRIRDTDLAQITADLIKEQIQNKAGIAVLAQGNKNSRYLLWLLA